MLILDDQFKMLSFVFVIKKKTQNFYISLDINGKINYILF